MNSLYKITIIPCVALTFILLSAFSFFKLLPNGSVSKVQNETQNINYYMNEVGKEILRCIKEKDKNGINNIFCDRIKDTQYLKDEIDIIFDYIDNNGGILIEDGEWTSPIGHGSNDYDGKTVEYLSCKYDGKVKIGNTQYVLRFTSYQILKKHIEYQGILTVSLTEFVSKDIINKAAEIKKEQQNEKKFLGFKLYNRNYDTYQNEILFDKNFYENDLYLIPSNLEDDR